MVIFKQKIPELNVFLDIKYHIAFNNFLNFCGFMFYFLKNNFLNKKS